MQDSNSLNGFGILFFIALKKLIIIYLYVYYRAIPHIFCLDNNSRIVKNWIKSNALSALHEKRKSAKSPFLACRSGSSVEPPDCVRDSLSPSWADSNVYCVAIAEFLTGMLPYSGTRHCACRYVIRYGIGHTAFICFDSVTYCETILTAS